MCLPALWHDHCAAPIAVTRHERYVTDCRSRHILQLTVICEVRVRQVLTRQHDVDDDTQQLQQQRHVCSTNLSKLTAMGNLRQSSFTTFLADSCNAMFGYCHNVASVICVKCRVSK